MLADACWCLLMLAKSCSSYILWLSRGVMACLRSCASKNSTKQSRPAAPPRRARWFWLIYWWAAGVMLDSLVLSCLGCCRVVTCVSPAHARFEQKKAGDTAQERTLPHPRLVLISLRFIDSLLMWCSLVLSCLGRCLVVDVPCVSPAHARFRQCTYNTQKKIGWLRPGGTRKWRVPRGSESLEAASPKVIFLEKNQKKILLYIFFCFREQSD